MIAFLIVVMVSIFGMVLGELILNGLMEISPKLKKHLEDEAREMEEYWIQNGNE